MNSRLLAIAAYLTLFGAAKLWAAPPQVFKGVDGYRLAPRTALVIGVPEVGEKANFLGLKNPAEDARAIARALRELGFDVVAPNESYEPPEMTRQTIKRAIYDFAQVLRSSGGIGVVYYSGHGVLRDGQMYLVPYGAYVQYDRDLEEEMLPIQFFYDAFRHANNPFNVLIIDACRNDPWNDGKIDAFGTPVRIEKTRELDTVVEATATLNGMKAFDGRQNSPYAAALVESLDVEDRDLFGLLSTDVSDSVSREMKALGVDKSSWQIPKVTFKGSHNFVFRPNRNTFEREFKIYRRGMETGNRSALEELVSKFAGGYFSRAARAALESGQLAPTKVTVPSILTEQVDAAIPSDTSVSAGDYLIALYNNNTTGAVSDQRTSLRKHFGRPFKTEVAVDRTAAAVEIQFADDQSVTPETVTQLKDVLRRSRSEESTVVLASYVRGKNAPKSASPGAGLLQQTTVLEAIKEAGLDASEIRLVEYTAASTKQINTVELKVLERTTVPVASDTGAPWSASSTISAGLIQLGMDIPPVVTKSSSIVSGVSTVANVVSVPTLGLGGIVAPAAAKVGIGPVSIPRIGKLF